MENDKIYLGDAYSLIKDIPDKSVDLIVTDPPYDICSKGGECFGNSERNYHAEYGAISPEEAKTKADGKSKLAYHQDRDMIKIREELSGISMSFDYSILEEFVRVERKCNVYIFVSRKQLRKVIDFFDDRGMTVDLLEWHKTNPIPTCGKSYLHDTELCVFARESGAPFEGSFQDKKHYFISETNKEDKQDFLHPTIKPLQFIEMMIRNSSSRGGLVLDPFCGSGTTCVAAKELGRHYIGFEINKKWHRIAEDRLNGINAEGQTSIFTDFDKVG